MAFTLATHLCGGRRSLSGVSGALQSARSKIEPLIALSLYPHRGPATDVLTTGRNRVFLGVDV